MTSRSDRYRDPAAREEEWHRYHQDVAAAEWESSVLSQHTYDTEREINERVSRYIDEDAQRTISQQHAPRRIPSDPSVSAGSSPRTADMALAIRVKSRDRLQSNAAERAVPRRDLRASVVDEDSVAVHEVYTFEETESESSIDEPPPPRRPSQPVAQASTLKAFRKSRKWPPAGFRSDEDECLEADVAEDVICAGANTFCGFDLSSSDHDFQDHAAFAEDNSYWITATMESEHSVRSDRAAVIHASFESMTFSGSLHPKFKLSGPEAEHLNCSVEKPNMSNIFGRLPGTCSLRHWVELSCPAYPRPLCRSSIRPRSTKLLAALERIHFLEQGLPQEEIHQPLIFLYSKLLRIGVEQSVPQLNLSYQIDDLILALQHSSFSDFSQVHNSIVAKFYETSDTDKRNSFFRQLLLATELQSRLDFLPAADQQGILDHVPEKVAYDLIVAQRWRSNIALTKQRAGGDTTFTFSLRCKSEQAEAIELFARRLRWPGLPLVKWRLKEDRRSSDPDAHIEDLSIYTTAWFSGVIVPGNSLSWIIMNALVDIDASAAKIAAPREPAAARSLKGLGDDGKDAGLQYSTASYWYHTSIVAKVLGAARGTNAVAGWVGPCIASSDLARVEVVRVRQKDVEERFTRLTRHDVETIGKRSHPLGPTTDQYPVDDYELVIPELDDVSDEIRVEKLCFQPYDELGGSARRRRQRGSSLNERDDMIEYEAAVKFAVQGRMLPMKLRYNVEFVSAYPCHEGPHVLFYDYAYKAVQVDEGLADVQDWNERAFRHNPQQAPSKALGDSREFVPPGFQHIDSFASTDTAATVGTYVSAKHKHSLHRNRATESSSSALSRAMSREKPQDLSPQLEEVLVVEALGVSDREVFARAWCAHWGCNALVARARETCLACAVREAYAACLPVVLVTG